MDNTVIFAALGGFVVNLLNLLEVRNVPKKQRPDFKDVFYWIPYLVHPLLGAVLAYAYVKSGMSLKPLLAMNVGISAPLVFRSMAEASPFRSKDIDPGAGA